jgi:hypothetical protein
MRIESDRPRNGRETANGKKKNWVVNKLKQSQALIGQGKLIKLTNGNAAVNLPTLFCVSRC